MLYMHGFTEAKTYASDLKADYKILLTSWRTYWTMQINAVCDTYLMISGSLAGIKLDTLEEYFIVDL